VNHYNLTSTFFFYFRSSVLPVTVTNLSS